jgi:hypothetical protein
MKKKLQEEKEKIENKIDEAGNKVRVVKLNDMTKG